MPYDLTERGEDRQGNLLQYGEHLHQYQEQPVPIPEIAPAAVRHKSFCTDDHKGKTNNRL